MSEILKPDRQSFPGGYGFTDLIVAVKLAASKHVANITFGTVEQAVVQRFLVELAARHPESVPFEDPFGLRSRELFNERRSFLNSHLRFSWFCLAYYVYGLLAIRSGISIAEYDHLNIFLTPVKRTLLELGVRVTDEECLAEVDRFVPAKVSPWSVEASAHTFLSYARFLHHSALRRREVVTPGLILPGVCLVFAEEDAPQANSILTFITTHEISVRQQPGEFQPTDRLLVLLSRSAMKSGLFWRGLADWKQRQAVPMVICLIPKAELYREPPSDPHREVWEWLAANIAVELGSENNRYIAILRALDSPDPKQWWWNYGDSVELGFAVDVLSLGIPRPAATRKASSPTREPYPYTFSGTLLAACLLASDRLNRDQANGPDARYFAICEDLLQLRLKPNGEPYSMPWFMLIYRAWLSFAGQLPGIIYSGQDPIHAQQELQSALFALGIGTNKLALAAFLEAFMQLPWTAPPSTPSAVDDRACSFIVLIHRLSQSALAGAQRVWLQHPFSPSFVSYARQDEDFARELVAHLEGKGADVWWDLNSITLGAPLDSSLRSAVADARFLFLVATPAADQSAYVRLEVETALRQGLRVIPMCFEGRVPAGLQSLLDSAPGSIEPAIPATDSDHASALGSALARLERSPSEQLSWLQSRAEYQNLRQNLAHARANLTR